MRIGYRIIAVMVILITLTVATFTAIVIETQKRTLLEGIDQKLLATATLARNILPEHYHDAIADSASVSPEEYIKIVDRYNRLCRQLNIQYLWSLMDFEGTVVFTSGTSTSKDISKGDFAPFFDKHTNPQAYAEAFRTMKVQYSTFHDKWGEGRMALVPAYDRHGRKYLFASSMEMREVSAKLAKTVETAVLIGLIVLAAAILLAILLANSISRPIVQLTRIARSIAEGDLRQTADMRGARELRSLSGSINFMSRAIREKMVELRSNTESLNITLNSIADGVIATDTEGRVTRMNPAAEYLTGWMRNEAIGRPLGAVFCLIDSQTRQPAEDPVNRVLVGGGTVSTANHPALITRSGEVRQITDSVAPIRDKRGKITGVVLVFRDVTWEYTAREELRESELRFRTLFEEARNPIFIADEDGRYIDTNRAGLEFLECGREEFLTKSIWSFAPPEAFEIQQKLHTPFPERRTRETDYLVNGKTKTLLLNVVPLSLSGRVHMYGIGLDITERKRAERELTEEKERLLVTLRSIGDAVIATDTRGAVILMNRVAEELTGWLQIDAIGKPLQEVFRIIDKKTREACTNPVEEVLEKDAVIGLANHTVLISREGIERSIEDSGAPIRDRGGVIRGVVLVFRDVTLRRRLEEELQKTQNLESVGVLAGGIAHDFNNILTGILGNLSLAKLDLNPESDLYPILEEAERETFRARDLTQQLLTFSKGGAPVRKITSISELLQNTVQFALRGSKVRCELSIPENLLPAEVDEGQFSQVISNLVINADQSMPRGGVVRVDAENIEVTVAMALPLKPGMYIRISVADQGIGIEPKHLPRIFDPYFSTKEKGHGLGLATTHSIVRRHNGHIRVESQPGIGSTFQIYFPALERRSVSRSQEAHVPRGGAEKVLVMDDEEVIRFTTRELLTRIGYTVETVRDGEEALACFRAARESGEPFDAVILDLTVPGGMGGLETLTRLRKLDPAIKAVVSSGYSGGAALAEFIRCGFNGVAAKPYHIDDLNRILREVLEG